MKNVLAFSLLVFGAACSGATTDPVTSASTTPPASGTHEPNPGAVGGEMTFRGVYEVPVPPELAAAATYPTAEVHWTLLNGTARLAYNLPKGLVGGSIRVDFSGPFDPATGKGMLTGAAGTSECTASATTVSCTEIMRGLLPIDADMERVEAIAREEYAGPVQHRIDVTQRFIGDPIGIVRFELSNGVTEPDHGTEHDEDEKD